MKFEILVVIIPKHEQTQRIFKSRIFWPLKSVLFLDASADFFAAPSSNMYFSLGSTFYPSVHTPQMRVCLAWAFMLFQIPKAG